MRCRQRVPSFYSYLPPTNLRLFHLHYYGITHYSSNFCSNTGLQPLCLLSLSLSKNDWWIWPLVKWTVILRLEEGGKVWIYFYGANNHGRPRPPHCRGLTITLGHTTIGSTPLDEWSAQRCDLHLISHNPRFQQPSGRTPMPYTGWPCESRLALNHLFKNSNSLFITFLKSLRL
jgi:hypothetical protein